MRDIWPILLALVFLAGTATAGMMMDGDDWGMMNGNGTGMMNGGPGAGGCPMVDSDDMHDWHEACEQIMEEECEGFDSEDCQEMYEECEEHMQHDHYYEDGESRDGCSMMGGR